MIFKYLKRVFFHAYPKPKFMNTFNDYQRFKIRKLYVISFKTIVRELLVNAKSDTCKKLGTCC